eukprot:TRINITY_DN9791_c0_g1_i2.p2 TRINITY_DN9791_c0_g1~~TRINITY_DN9791_c0_g1_i2.p2  ORF type:complete len:271 (+),score=143.41 TRINITY_DN9791_c0_g1_i2:129-941(+)
MTQKSAPVQKSPKKKKAKAAAAEPEQQPAKKEWTQDPAIRKARKERRKQEREETRAAQADRREELQKQKERRQRKREEWDQQQAALEKAEEELVGEEEEEEEVDPETDMAFTALGRLHALAAGSLNLSWPVLCDPDTVMEEAEAHAGTVSEKQRKRAESLAAILQKCADKLQAGEVSPDVLNSRLPEVCLAFLGCFKPLFKACLDGPERERISSWLSNQRAPLLEQLRGKKSGGADDTEPPQQEQKGEKRAAEDGAGGKKKKRRREGDGQ